MGVVGVAFTLARSLGNSGVARAGLSTEEDRGWSSTLDGAPA